MPDGGVKVAVGAGAPGRRFCYDPCVTTGRICALAAALALAGCAPGSTGGSRGGEPAGAPDLQAKVEVARQKAALAQAELANQEAANRIALERLDKELDLAQADLKRLREADGPARIAQADLDLAAARHAAEDAADELAQLEKMYGANDLADQTKEIVLKRGRRDLERARAGAAIKEAQLKLLKEHVLPAETGKLALEESAKRALLAVEKEKAANSLLQKRIALAEARMELAAAEKELNKTK